MQAQFICLSVNLLQTSEHELEQAGNSNAAEKKRRAERLDLAKAKGASQKKDLPKALRLMQEITQHSANLIHWVAPQLWLHAPWQEACAPLAAL